MQFPALGSAADAEYYMYVCMHAEILNIICMHACIQKYPYILYECMHAYRHIAEFYMHVYACIQTHR